MGIFESLLIGISIAAIPGPLFFELVRRSLTKGFWSGALLAVGEFTGNILIMSLIFLGFKAFLSSEFLVIFLSIAGGFILVWIGASAFILKKEQINEPHKKKRYNENSLATGLAITFTNTLAIVLWISLAGSYIAQSGSDYRAFLNIFLIAFGFLIFYFPLAAIVNYTGSKVPSKYLPGVSRVFGIILIVYGISFFYRAIKLIRV
ncbi:LysE family translocator [Candidatus Woesearchaeota archaeon]|nr:LysE family translocator [Candidatus Woesearchaeota archaeon]